MTPNMAPVSVSLCLEGRSIVRGCPGVARSMPRIETTLEIRTNEQYLRVRSVGVELRTCQNVSVPSTIGANETFREYKVYEDKFAYRPPLGEFHQALIGLDLPILIPLSKNIISSGLYPNWSASTVHNLYVTVRYGDSAENEVSFVETFPVIIKLYDTLPLYRQFNEPIVETATSQDRQVVLELSLPVSSVGPSDDFTMYIKIMANSLHNKIRKNLRLNKVTLQIKEILECHEGGLPGKKEYKIFTTTQMIDPENNLLDSNGKALSFQFQYPVENDYLSTFAGKLLELRPDTKLPYNPQPHYQYDDELAVIQSFNISKVIPIGELAEGIPLTHIQGFTTLGKLFSIRYEINLKVKLSHAKDMEIRLPLTVCPFDRISSDYLLLWIMGECEIAREKFGKHLIDQLVNSNYYEESIRAMERYRPRPTAYRYTKADWVLLGYSPESFGNKMARLLTYID